MNDAPETALWTELKVLLRLVAAIFGEPASLLEEGAVARREGELLRGWLSALEAIARALLLAMAASLPRPTCGRAPAGRWVRPARTEQVHADRDNEPWTDGAAAVDRPGSERWAGVAFRASPRSRGARGMRASTGAPRGLLFTRPLAYRLEALIRVAEAPQPYARRLARRLRAEPGLAARVLRAPPAGACAPPCADLVEQALFRARQAGAVFARKPHAAPP
ncbi:MAG: hypothetical protein GWO02_15175 [Gammaproteobacteria bacterium]|nr:hypothetical protein [Gammaproteobacteria bacterium]